MSPYSFLTSNTAPTCRDFAASNFFPSSEFRSIEPNSGPKIRLLFVLESSLPFSSSFSAGKKKKKGKRINKLLYTNLIQSSYLNGFRIEESGSEVQALKELPSLPRRSAPCH